MPPIRKKDSAPAAPGVRVILAEAPDLAEFKPGEFAMVAYRVRALGIGYAGLPRHELRGAGDEFDMDIPVGLAPNGKPIEPPYWVEILGPAFTLERAPAPEL